MYASGLAVRRALEFTLLGDSAALQRRVVGREHQPDLVQRDLEIAQPDDRVVRRHRRTVSRPGPRAGATGPGKIRTFLRLHRFPRPIEIFRRLRSSIMPLPQSWKAAGINTPT